MFNRAKAVCFLFSSLACTVVTAQSEDSFQLPEMASIAAQRLVLAQEKNTVLDHFQESSKACWKQFAVNDCLFKAKQQKYQGLTPLEQREIALNERQRYLKESERQQRINGKTLENAKDKAIP